MLRALILSLSLAFATAAFPMGERPPVAPLALQMDVDLEAAALDISIPLIAKWEGKRNAAYLDIVGVPTICFGSTRGVKIGDYMSDARCTALLRAEVAEYQAGFSGYLSHETVAQRLTPHRFAAFTSTAYNVGISGIGRSTATRRLNAGDIPGACEALTWWNKAGGRVVRGLVLRRTNERTLCMARCDDLAMSACFWCAGMRQSHICSLKILLSERALKICEHGPDGFQFILKVSDAEM